MSPPRAQLNLTMKRFVGEHTDAKLGPSRILNNMIDEFSLDKVWVFSPASISTRPTTKRPSLMIPKTSKTWKYWRRKKVMRVTEFLDQKLTESRVQTPIRSVIFDGWVRISPLFPHCSLTR
jgi:hypothetical protein